MKKQKVSKKNFKEQPKKVLYGVDRTNPECNYRNYLVYRMYKHDEGKEEIVETKLYMFANFVNGDLFFVEVLDENLIDALTKLIDYRIEVKTKEELKKEETEYL